MVDLVSDWLAASGKANDPGRPGTDDHRFVKGCLQVPSPATPWRDLPERHGRLAATLIAIMQEHKEGQIDDLHLGR